jgi:predicted peptidase
MRITFVSILATGFITGLALAQATTKPTSRPSSAPAPRLGSFHISFTDQSPLSPLDAQRKRHHIREEDMQRYTLADESFEAFVPENYDARQKYGILVWVSAGNRGTMPRGWTELLTKHKLIGIGANNSGNPRGVAVRFGLAIDAVHNLKKLHNVDENRVYVSGISGGGKVASMLGMIYPEVFRGAMPIVGVTYFREIPVPNEKGKAYARSFDRPPAAMLNRARQGRFVLITGSEDMNRDPTRATYEQGFKKDGFKNVEYIEVPGDSVSRRARA